MPIYGEPMTQSHVWSYMAIFLRYYNTKTSNNNKPTHQFHHTIIKFYYYFIILRTMRYKLLDNLYDGKTN